MARLAHEQSVAAVVISSEEEEEEEEEEEILDVADEVAVMQAGRLEEPARPVGEFWVLGIRRHALGDRSVATQRTSPKLLRNFGLS